MSRELIIHYRFPHVYQEYRFPNVVQVQLFYTPNALDGLYSRTSGKHNHQLYTTLQGPSMSLSFLKFYLLTSWTSRDSQYFSRSEYKRVCFRSFHRDRGRYTKYSYNTETNFIPSICDLLAEAVFHDEVSKSAEFASLTDVLICLTWACKIRGLRGVSSPRQDGVMWKICGFKSESRMFFHSFQRQKKIGQGFDRFLSIPQCFLLGSPVSSLSPKMCCRLIGFSELSRME